MKCVYCLEEGEIAPEQVLVRGEHLYLCAPRGPIVPGFLAIAPFRCIGCVGAFPAEYFDELDRLVDRVRAFYRAAYGQRDATFYEQGRAGGSLEGRPHFPLHAHLCCLPVDLELDRALEDKYTRCPLAGPRELTLIADQGPYIYVESRGVYRAYVGSSPEARLALKRSELRRDVAVLVGQPERGSWRDCDDREELNAIVRLWNVHI